MASSDGAVGHNVPDFSSGHGPQTQLKYGEKYTFPQDLPKFSGEQNACDKFRCEFLFLWFIFTVKMDNVIFMILNGGEDERVHTIFF